jgi:hypothetical protein
VLSLTGIHMISVCRFLNLFDRSKYVLDVFVSFCFNLLPFTFPNVAGEALGVVGIELSWHFRCPKVTGEF